MKTAIKHDIREISWPAKTFVASRATKSFDELPSFFAKSYGEIYGQLQKKGIETNEMPCAIYYKIDEEAKKTDLAAAVPVKSKAPDIKGLEKINLPKSKVLTTTHYGSYESMGETYSALENYMSEHALKRELIIEEYLTDPAVEKDPAKLKTNIYFIVKPVKN